MILYDWFSFLVRLVILIPSTYLFFLFIISAMKDKTINGLSGTRLAVFLLIVGVGLENAIRLYGDIHVIYGFSQSVQGWLGDMKWVILASRMVLFFGISKFAYLFLKNKNNG